MKRTEVVARYLTKKETSCQETFVIYSSYISQLSFIYQAPFSCQNEECFLFTTISDFPVIMDLGKKNPLLSRTLGDLMLLTTHLSPGIGADVAFSLGVSLIHVCIEGLFIIFPNNI